MTLLNLKFQLLVSVEVSCAGTHLDPSNVSILFRYVISQCASYHSQDNDQLSNAATCFPLGGIGVRRTGNQVRSIHDVIVTGVELPQASGGLNPMCA